MALVASPSAVPAPRAQRPQAAHWIYVDEPRTHRVEARLLPRDGAFVFIVEERVFGGGADDAWRTLSPVRETWEAKFHQAELEARLAGMGRYWGAQPPTPGWRPLRRNPAFPPVDLATLDFDMKGAGFHHFHDSAKARARLLVSLPRPRPGRFALAGLDFEQMNVEEADLSILHPSLAAPLLRSALAREHMTMAERGYEKLRTAQDFALLYGPDWRREVVRTFEGAMVRIESGPEGRPVAASQAAPEPETTFTDYHAAFQDKRLLAVHRRFLRADDEQGLLASDVPTIRRAIAAKRRSAQHAHQHLLTVLEASLLARLAFKTQTPVDPESARVLRRRAYYL